MPSRYARILATVYGRDSTQVSHNPEPSAARVREGVPAQAPSPPAAVRRDDERGQALAAGDAGHSRAGRSTARG